jgi:hypothetical protein
MSDIKYPLLSPELHKKTILCLFWMDKLVKKRLFIPTLGIWADRKSAFI